jgi:hypothetical protein
MTAEIRIKHGWHVWICGERVFFITKNFTLWEIAITLQSSDEILNFDVPFSYTIDDVGAESFLKISGSEKIWVTVMLTEFAESSNYHHIWYQIKKLCLRHGCVMIVGRWQHELKGDGLQVVWNVRPRAKGKVVPVLTWLSTMPWRHVGEWMYRSTFSWPRH